VRVDLSEKNLQSLSTQRVLVIGMGGLGCAAVWDMVRLGVRQLVLVDFDRVERSNLSRQWLYQEQHLGQYKVLVAQEQLQQHQTNLHIVALTERMNGDLLDQWLPQIDVVLDCSDNFPTRFMLNRACVRWQKSLVSGAAIQFNGQVACFLPYLPESPCYHCLYPDEAFTQTETETCTVSGVLTPLPSVIGSIQAIETIKILLKIGQPLSAKLLLFDALNSRWKTLRLPKDPACVVCGG
jgi:molybdopterin-synthase adenylyltransferase